MPLRAYPGEISLPDLQHAFEARVENTLRVFDDFAINTDRTLFQLATGF